jgi:ABC-type multidrug transport system fused ATPase/permease subunit
VAHRMYGAQISDWVIVLDQGQLVEQGPPGVLAQSGSFYQRLLEAELFSVVGGPNS